MDTVETPICVGNLETRMKLHQHASRRSNNSHDQLLLVLNSKGIAVVHVDIASTDTGNSSPSDYFSH